MRAELASIDDPLARWRFARSAAAVAFRQGIGLRLAAAALVGTVVAALTVLVSRAQLADGGPGVMLATIPGPVLPLLVAAWVTAHASRSFRFGLETGLLAVATSFVGMAVVLAVEGQVWMARLGVFMLDGDPPKDPLGATTVALNLFATGLWIPHLLWWLPWPVIGAALGAGLAARSNRVLKVG